MRFYIENIIVEYAPRTRLAVVMLDDVQVGYGHSSLDDMRLRVARKIREEVQHSSAVKTTPQIAGLEQLMAKFDPNARRTPAVAETLVAKVLDERPMPVENDAVDVATLLAIYYKLPVFVNDRRDLRGNIGLVVGRPNRPFEVRQGDLPLDTGGRLFLTDDTGYFDSVIRIGKRAYVGERTRQILLTALFPENVGDSIIRDFVRRGGNWLQTLCGGEVVHEGMVGQSEGE